MWNPWVGQHQGKDDPKIVRISPFFYGQHGLLNILYIPKLRDLPQDAMDLKAMVFDFGFNAPNPLLGPRATAKVNLQVERPLMLWGITGVSNQPEGFQLQFYHTHEGSQRQFFSKHASDPEICGTGAHLHIMRSPYLVIKGDQLTCEVKNLSDAGDTAIQVVLFGGEFD